MALPTATLRASLPFLPVAGGLFCIQLDFFSLGLALPTIAGEMGTTVTDLQTLRGLSAAAAGLAFCSSSIGFAACGPLAGWLTTRVPAGLLMAVSVLACPPALALLAFAGPLPLYVVALGLCGLATGMGFGLGRLAIQNVLPPQRSAEGTGVLLTSFICLGGLLVAGVATLVSQWPRRRVAEPVLT